MTGLEVLEEIKNLYHEHLKTEIQIADEYNTTPDNISYILTALGYHYGLLKKNKKPSIAKAWQDPEVQRLCEEIAKNK